MKQSLLWSKMILSLALISIIFGCENDPSTVGGELTGATNFNTDIYKVSPVVFSRAFERVQTNGLPCNLLGVYDDPIYGQTQYDILSQLNPFVNNNNNLVFGANAKIDSIVFNLPYFSTEQSAVSLNLKASTRENDSVRVIRRTYNLDSIYGSAPMKLSVFKSNYFLSDVEVGSQDRRVYFSDEINSFGNAVEAELLFSIDTFVPSKDEIMLRKTDTVMENDEIIQEFAYTFESPRLRKVFKDLDNPEERKVIDLFKEMILDNEGSLVLSDANNFFNFFRGIYLKAEPIDNKGSLIYLNTSTANFTIYYSDTTTMVDDNGTSKETTSLGTYILPFANNIVNGVKNNFVLEVDDQNTEQGESRLFLKGGVGSYGVIRLFGEDADDNGVSDELERIRENNWIINEANLKFYVDKDQFPDDTNSAAPERVYIFNAETGAVLIDYLADASRNDVDPLVSRTNHLGRLVRGTDDTGDFYKIRITQHLTDVIENSTEDALLGIAVSQNVNEIAPVQGVTSETEDTTALTPSSSVVSHEGTVLFGNADDVPEEKKLFLEISYTTSINN